MSIDEDIWNYIRREDPLHISKMGGSTKAATNSPHANLTATEMKQRMDEAELRLRSVQDRIVTPWVKVMEHHLMGQMYRALVPRNTRLERWLIKWVEPWIRWNPCTKNELLYVAPKAPADALPDWLESWTISVDPAFGRDETVVIVPPGLFRSDLKAEHTLGYSFGLRRPPFVTLSGFTA